MSRSYTPSPPKATMACSGTTLLFYRQGKLRFETNRNNKDDGDDEEENKKEAIT
jgi:hypothetical protein